jgi:hypothetical protein
MSTEADRLIDAYRQFAQALETLADATAKPYHDGELERGRVLSAAVDARSDELTDAWNKMAPLPLTEAELQTVNELAQRIAGLFTRLNSAVLRRHRESFGSTKN